MHVRIPSAPCELPSPPRARRPPISGRSPNEHHTTSLQVWYISLKSAVNLMMAGAEPEPISAIAYAYTIGIMHLGCVASWTMLRAALAPVD